MGKRITDPVEALAEKTAERVIDLVVRTLDVNAVVERVDLNAILDRVDIDKLVDRVDVDKILARVDVDKLVDRVDVDKVLDQVDVDKVLDQVDMDKVLAKVDLDELLARVDVDAVVDRVDINAIAQRVDIDAVAMHTDIGAMIARSSGGVASDARDAARSQAVGLDEWIARWVARLLRRDPPAPRPHFGGAVSRFVAYAVDLGVSTGVFMLALAAISFAASVIVGHSISWSRNDLPVAILYVVWLFVYFAYSWGASGKTLGMALLGVRVVAADGTEAGPRRAVIRTLAFPLSFLVFGLGFTGILFQRDRRALHDMIAGTAVVYYWQARAARLRYLDRPSPALPSPDRLSPDPETPAELA
ncbi:MAG TPA: RDD family protein [Streptosporangiaceae bacterium]|nr:RDD family protein [Streptosporangiaceae bacterium]